MSSLPFLKMNGAGNDFVVFDARRIPLSLTPVQLQAVAARSNAETKGCDQVIVIRPSEKANAFMAIYNADGSEVSACGNATRCIGWLLMRERQADRVTIETKAGMLTATQSGTDQVTVDMGAPKLDWQSIPLAERQDTLHLNLTIDGLTDPAAVSMGNPHVVFFVKNVATTHVATLGASIETHPLFPERVNVSFAQILSEDSIRLRVWERGAGETQACGTAACAVLVAAHRRGLTGQKADVELPGGTLHINWQMETDGHIWQTGAVALEFEGVAHV